MDYFEHHLLRDVWLAYDETSRRSALRMAENDIRAELDAVTPNPGDDLWIAAVHEQAVWLLRNPAAVTPAASDIQSEQVDGVGSRTYRAGGAPWINPKSQRLIALLRRQHGLNTCRISRG